MKRLIAIILLSAILGCSNGAASQPTGTEASLQERAELQTAAFSEGRWLDVWALQSPRFRAVCKSGDFALVTTMGLGFLRGLLGIADNVPLGFEITKIQEIGESGRVWSEVTYNGQPVDFGGENKGDLWVRVDGVWYSEPDKWEAGCNPQEIFGGQK